VTFYLVTGGAGFIGSNVVRALVEQGHRVRVYDDLSTGYAANLAGIEGDIEFLEADLRDSATLRQAVNGVEAIVHLGALPSVARSLNDPFASHETNTTATINLLEFCRQAGVRRLVFASSSSVYGDTPTLPKVETMPTNPLSPYAVSKLAAEQYCKVYSQLYGLEAVALRYFNVFGPRQDPKSDYAAVIPKFINLMLRGEQPLIHGDGLQSRDFTYIDNIVQANILASQAEGAGGEILNVACGQRYTLLDLVQNLNEILGTSIEPRFGPPRPGDVKHSMADSSRAMEKIGYRVLVDFKTGLERTVDWLRAHPERSA
jgi:UDP-glucose 4-epimerase